MNKRIPFFLILIIMFACAQLSAAAKQPAPKSVAVVLGCYPVADDVPDPLQTARIYEAARLYAAGKADTIVVSGGFTRGHISEARMGKIALVALGVPEKAVLEEERSSTTIENGIFSAEMFDKLGWKKEALLVSQKIHLVRAKPIFEKYGFKAKNAASDTPVTDKDYPAAPGGMPADWGGTTIILYEPYAGDAAADFPPPASVKRLQAAAAAARANPAAKVIVFNDWYTRGAVDPSETDKVALITLGVKPDAIVAEKHIRYGKLSWLAGKYGKERALFIGPADAAGEASRTTDGRWAAWVVD